MVAALNFLPQSVFQGRQQHDNQQLYLDFIIISTFAVFFPDPRPAILSTLPQSYGHDGQPPAEFGCT